MNFPHTEIDLFEQCRAVYGGVSWPTKRAGHAIVVAMMKEQHFDSHDIYVLWEFGSFDIRELVRQCGAMDVQYNPSLWVGDNKNEAADVHIKEMVRENRAQKKAFCVMPTMIMEIKELYSYILPKLKELLNPSRRLLHLKDSNIVNHLASIEENEIDGLRMGEYPAIEALAFAVIVMQKHYPAEETPIISDRIGYKHQEKRPKSPMVMG